MTALEVAAGIVLTLAAAGAMLRFAECVHTAEETQRRQPEAHRKYRRLTPVWVAASSVLLMLLGGLLT